MVWFVLGVVLLMALMIGFSNHRRPKQIDPEQAARDEARLHEAVADRQRLAQPTLLLRSAPGSMRSRLGGSPNLPLGVEWPLGRDGPMGFLLQVDLAEARQAGGPDWLPASGLLCLFYNEDYGLAEQCRVLLVQSQDSAATPPLTLPRRRLHPERSIGFERWTSFPSSDWMNIAPRSLDAWDKLVGEEEPPFADAPQHRVGGYPDEIQNEMLWMSCELLVRGLEPYDYDAPPDLEIFEAARSWRLLFQVDSDETLKTNWGDGGMLYVFVREEDARAGDFSKTVTLSQTH